MAAAKTKKNSVIIGGKEYHLPRPLDTDAYMHFLEVRDEIMNTEKTSGLYTAKQFKDMMDCIVELYENQFTVEELKDKKTGLGVSGIIMEFAAIEVGVGEAVNDEVARFQTNFTSGK